MSPKNPLIHVRVDEELKDKATAILMEYGLTVSDAVRILLNVIVKDNGLPPFMLSSPEQHDAWFREKVLQALENPAPRIPHDEAMRRIRANLEEGSSTTK